MRLIDADKFREQVITASLINGTEKAAKKAESLIKIIDSQETVKTESEWIPVEESLPKCGRAVLICHEGGAQDVGRYEEGVWRTGFSHADIKSDIVAWQPLPKPYRRED